MRAVIYARYSPGPDQREESIAGQLRECRALAEREAGRVGIRLEERTRLVRIRRIGLEAGAIAVPPELDLYQFFKNGK